MLINRYNLQDPDERAKFAIESTAVVQALKNPVEQEQYFKYISDRTKFSVEVLKRQAELVPKSQREQPEPEQAPQVKVEYDVAIKFFLASIVDGCDYIDFDTDVSEAMPDAFAKKLYVQAKNGAANGNARLDFDEYTDDEKHLLNELMDYKFLPGDGREAFVEVENKLYIKVLEKECDAFKTEYDKTKNLSALRKMQEISTEITNRKRR